MCEQREKDIDIGLHVNRNENESEKHTTRPGVILWASYAVWIYSSWFLFYFPIVFLTALQIFLVVFMLYRWLNACMFNSYSNWMKRPALTDSKKIKWYIIF